MSQCKECDGVGGYTCTPHQCGNRPQTNTPVDNHIHKSDGSTANPSKLVCKLCGDTYSYDSNLHNSIKPTPTDNAWLDELMEFDIWCMCGADECVLYQNYKQAKATILTHIDTVCREARGCVDCKKLRCENCERLWAS